jgi:hypothetical protein
MKNQELNHIYVTGILCDTVFDELVPVHGKIEQFKDFTLDDYDLYLSWLEDDYRSEAFIAIWSSGEHCLCDCSFYLAECNNRYIGEFLKGEPINLFFYPDENLELGEIISYEYNDKIYLFWKE